MLRRLVSYSCSYEARMSPALNGSSAIRRFERSDAIDIRDGITFDFYTGLPHIQTLLSCRVTVCYNIECYCLTKITSVFEMLQVNFLPTNVVVQDISFIEYQYSRSKM